MNWIVSAHLLLSKITSMQVKALCLRREFRIDTIGLWVLHGREMRQNVTGLGQKEFIWS